MTLEASLGCCQPHSVGWLSSRSGAGGAVLLSDRSVERRSDRGQPIVCLLLEGGPRARRRFSGVGFPCLRLGSGEARSCPLNGPILDLIAPIRPLQLCADGGYQLRFRGLEGTPNYGPRHLRQALLPGLRHEPQATW
jgi:hypothetical protein